MSPLNTAPRTLSTSLILCPSSNLSIEHQGNIFRFHISLFSQITLTRATMSSMMSRHERAMQISPIPPCLQNNASVRTAHTFHEFSSLPYNTPCSHFFIAIFTLRIRLSFFFLDDFAAMKGKVFLMAGDARQIGPVVEFGGEAETYQASIMSSKFYRDNVQVYHLSKTMRNIGDPAFSTMVDRIGDDLLSPDADGLIEIDGVKTETDLDSSIDYIFPPEVLRDPLLCSKRANITSHNVTVDDINDLVLSRVEGEEHVLEGRSVLDHEHLECDLNDAFCMSDHLCTVHHSGVPSHTLRLKVGIVVMLTRNLDISQGLCNSSKLVVLDISRYTLRVKTLTDGIEHFLPRITFGFITKQGVAVKRVQFPVRLCFAVTYTSPKDRLWTRFCSTIERMCSCMVVCM